MASVGGLIGKRRHRSSSSYKLAPVLVAFC